MIVRITGWWPIVELRTSRCCVTARFAAAFFPSDGWVSRLRVRDLANRSLAKYKLIIEDFGGWGLFQELLEVLSRIAAAHDTDIASVATRVMLDRDQVAAAIVGAVNTSHLHAHAQIGTLRLHADELSSIANVIRRRRGPAGRRIRFGARSLGRSRSDHEV